MDFPRILTSYSPYTYAMEEFKNTIYVLLKNHLGTFIQSNRLGTRLDIHCPEPDDVKYSIRDTLEQIPNTEVQDVQVLSSGKYYDIKLYVKYLDDIIEFNFSYENEK